jgi:transcription antitermination factor NusG
MLSLADTPPETNAPNLLNPRIGWIVALVKTNHEKDTARKLDASDCTYYLPYEKTKTKSRNTVLKPKFSGYIFVGQHFGGRYPLVKAPNMADAIAAVRSTRNVLSIMPVIDQFRMRLEIYMMSGRDVLPAHTFTKGQRVAFTDETELNGVVGVVDGTNDSRVIVNFECMGMPISLKVEPNEIRMV